MPFSACSVPACIRSSSSPAGRAASTAAARRKACTRYVGAPPRSSSNAICRSAWRGSTSGLLPTPRQNPLERVHGALGFLELGLDRIDAAICELETVERLTQGSGHEEPVIVPWVPDLVEAYARQGREGDARRVLA